MRTGLRLSLVPAAVVAAALMMSGVPSRARADWPEFGRAISTASNAQQHSVVASDGAGGALIAWQDLQSPRVNIFAGHVLASGDVDPAWPFDGQPLLTDSLGLATADGGQTSPVIVADGTGGAIVAWQDNRSPVTETDVFAQHVLGSGLVDRAWPANGRALVAAPGLQNTIAIATDGAGGAIVTWVDSRAGADLFDIFAQHVLKSGVVDPRWPVNGLAVCTAPGPQGFPVLVADGLGGAIIAWHDDRDAATGFDIFAQHVLGSGVVDPAWPVDGRALCTATGDQARPTIATDGLHGAIVAWSDSRIVGTSHIFAQHVFGTGVVDPVWPVNGQPISDAGLLESRPLAVTDGRGGAIVTWQAFTVHLNMFAQHVEASGVVDPAWIPGGRPLSITERQQSLAEIVPDGSGGAVVAWQDSFDIVAQHVLGSGALDPAYPDTGRSLVNLASPQGGVALTATGGGGAIATWTDGRNGKDADIYALQVVAVAGTVDVPPGATPREISFAPPSPNPARVALALQFVLPRSTWVRLAVYDLSGRRVRALASGARPAGPQTIAWDLRDDGGRAVGTGLYFARLEAEGRSLTQKVARVE